MNHVLNKAVFLVVTLFICGGMAGCSLIPLSAAPIDSQVLDAETGQPIEGAVVVAIWELRGGSLTGDSLPCGAANVEEAVSGKDGRFHLAGWGPKWPACGGTMRGAEPMIYVYKAGYHHGVFANGDPSAVNVIFRTSSAWQSRQMKLKPFHAINYQDWSASGVRSDYDALNIYLGMFIVNMPTQCNWKKIPHMLVALELEREKISWAVGYPYDAITADLLDTGQWFEKTAPKCGSPRTFLEGLLHETGSH